MKAKIEQWKFPISMASTLIIVFSILLNAAGRMISMQYNWPIWADSAGTFLAGILLGPFGGMLVGAGTPLLLGVLDTQSLYYVPVGLGVGFAVGVSFPHGNKLNAYRVFAMSMNTNLISAVLSSITNLIFFHGEVGNVWGDALVEWINSVNQIPVLPTFLGEMLVNFPDKVVGVVVAMSLIGSFMLFAEMHEFPKLFGTTALILLLVAGLMLPAFSVEAIELQKRNSTEEYAATVFDSSDGLYSSEINAVAQTPDGYIWVGGYSGLYRFDGRKFEQVDVANNVNSITELSVDEEGYLWIGTNDMGAVKYDIQNDKAYVYGVADGLPVESVRAIAEGPFANVFVGTVSYSAVIRHNGRVGVYNQLDSLNYINNFAIDEAGNCAAVSQHGHVLLIADQLINYVKNCDIPEAFYISAAWESPGELWLGTSTNVMEHYRLADGQLLLEETVTLDELTYINEIQYSSFFDGFFICAENGMGFLDNTGNFWNLSTSNFNSSVNDVLVDYQGNIWFTSGKQGVMKFSINIFTDMTKRSGIDMGTVNCLYREDCYLYMGTDNGLYVQDIYTNQIMNYEWLKPFEGTRIRHIMKDSRGSLWICTYGGYGLIERKASGETVVYGGSESEDSAERFRMAIELSNGTIAAAGMNGLYLIKDGEVVQSIKEEDGLQVPQIMCLLETDDEKLLACSDGDGIYVIQRGEIVDHINKRVGLTSLVVLRALKCGEGYLYITSNALFYDDGKNITRLSNFPFSNNYDAMVTDDGKLWVTGSAGVYVADVEDVLANNENYPYLLLDYSRGLDTHLSSDGWNVSDPTDMYFCCADGVRRISRATYGVSIIDYIICMDRITVDGEKAPLVDGVYQIPSGNGKIVIRPGILNYAMTNPMVRCYIEGMPETIVESRQSGLESTTLTELKYGDYTYHIQILGEYTGDVERDEVFYFHKEPKMYERTYYRLYVLIVSILFVTFLVWMIAQIRSLSTIEQQYEEIREAKDEAEVANKAKSNFLASMSHEIRTPINAVLGMDEMILRESKDSSILEYATDIYSAGQTLLALINEILDSSKLESGKMELVPVEYELGAMIHNLHNLIIQRASVADLSLIVEVDRSLPRKLKGDDVRVRQIITNMLTNAVKYTDEGTVWFRILGTCEGNIAHLRIEVEDTGAGIKEEDIPRLFDAYKRLDLGKNHYVEGSGLGLNISMHLLELMGSRLQVESEYGKGSKFFFDLDQEIVDATPLGEKYDPTSAKGTDKSEHSAGSFRAPNARVLVVDDNSMNRRVFKSLVKEMKMQVSEAASGPEAIEFAKTEYFDLIFMDHMMPEMDGVEAMQYIRSLEGIPCEHTPIYVLTANAVTGAKEAYFEAGFDGFVSKPIIFEKLEEAIREALPAELIEEVPEGLESSSANQGPQMPEDLPAVDGLDWSFAWLHLPGMELLEESLGEFYTLIPVQSKKLSGMYDALAANPEDAAALDEYRILVHAMKSLAATVGIIPLAGTAKILEFAAKDQKLDVILKMHPVFIKEWDSYTEKLRGVFHIGEEDKSEKKPGNLLLLQKLSEIIVEALNHMDIDRSDKALAKLREFTFGENVDAMIPTLVGAVTDLDESLAKDTLQQMISAMEQ
ncbi:MAG: response regulator [Lachnospiraceae bacterium]|nr:response regulator [Lachnospiraceae bacterium]